MNILTLFALIFICSGQALASGISPSYSTLLKKSYRLQWDSRYFQSDSAINFAGVEEPFPLQKKFIRWDNDIGLSYGLNERLEPSVGIRYRFNNAPEEGIHRNGVESFWFRFKYRIPLSPRFQLTADTRFGQTVHSKDTPRTTLLLGDPGNESEWGAHLTWFASPTLSLSLYGAYRKPPNQLSDEVPYSVKLLWQKNNRGLSLGIDGLASLNTDPYVSESARDKLYFTGGSRHDNSFNRQWLRPQATLYYALSPHWTIHLQAANTVYVRSGDKGMQFGLGLSWTSKGITPSEKKINRFKEYFITANVTKVSKRQRFVQIDQGLGADIYKGMKFDIYTSGFSKESSLLASGIVWQVESNKSIIRLTKRYNKNKKIQPGSIARGY